jgi:hypothetical protein
MRTFSLLLVALVALTFGTLPYAGSQKSEKPSALPPPNLPLPNGPLPPALAQAPVHPVSRTPKTEAEKLRERYLDLARKHGDILTDEALYAWIAQIEKRVNEDQANHELNKVRESLKEIAKKYPNTGAAREARQMLGLTTASTTEGSLPADGARALSPDRKKD